MNLVQLTKISEVKTEKERSDKKVSRQYYTAEFSDPSNPFNAPRIRNFYQQHNVTGDACAWKGAEPSKVVQFLNKTIPGAIVKRNVAPYKVEGSENTATKFTTVCLAHEDITAVFKAAGHTIIEDQESVSNTETTSNSGIKLAA